MNKVFKDKNTAIPMTPKELADAANKICKGNPFRAWDFAPANINSRIGGNGHCDCCGNGEFVILPENDPDVQSGMKRYMQCRKCGGWSHL